jgi:hypothetical protein
LDVFKKEKILLLFTKRARLPACGGVNFYNAGVVTPDRRIGSGILLILMQFKNIKVTKL